MVHEIEWKPTDSFAKLLAELEPEEKILKDFEQEIGLRANDRTGEEFSVRLGNRNCQPGFFICIRRKLLTGRIEGAKYPWYTYLMLCPRRWINANLRFVEEKLLATGIVPKMPQAWFKLYESLPGGDGYAEIFFPFKKEEEEGGNQQDSSPHFSKPAIDCGFRRMPNPIPFSGVRKKYDPILIGFFTSKIYRVQKPAGALRTMTPG